MTLGENLLRVIELGWLKDGHLTFGNDVRTNVHLLLYIRKLYFKILIHFLLSILLLNLGIKTWAGFNEVVLNCVYLPAI